MFRSGTNDYVWTLPRKTRRMRDPAYFLYHSIGQYPGKAAEMAAAFAAFSDVWSAQDDAQWPLALAQRAAFIRLWSDLIDAPEGTLTSAENVTAGLYSIIGGLPAARLSGKRVLIAADCFPSLHFLLSGMAERMGFELHTVAMRDGEAWVHDADMIAAWGPDVALALLTFVTSTASHRPDLDALLAQGRDMGSLVGLDLTQGAGLLPFSLTQTPVDFVVSTSLKWLCGTPGAGIIQMREDLIRDVTPELRGWFSQPDPFSWDLDAFDYAPDARRFDHGTPSVLACVGSVPALRWHAGQTGLAAHNGALTDAIIVAADAQGRAIVTPRDPASRGGSVMLRLDGDAKRVVAALRGRGIHVDCRGQTLRISPGAVTQAHHVDTLFSALNEFC